MKRGVSLYFTIVILTVLAATFLALISILIGQIKVIWAIGDSVIAFYASDTGIEQALYRIRKQENIEDFSGTLGEASYNVSITVDEEETIVRSKGTYRKTNRAIETKH